MAQIQLYAKKQDTGVWTLLDLHASEPIKLNLSVQNIIDPTATTSVFSRTFKVPHTSINGPFFEGVFNVNSMDFDASKKADAYILDNGIFYQNGNITLNAIWNNEADNSIEYEITFYGATSDFGTKIGGGFLNEVDLNMYNHSKDFSNITMSWNGGLFNGDVVYGLIEWGYTYNKNNQPNIPTLSANFPLTAYPTPAHTVDDPKGSFTNSQYPYLLEQFKPQIRAKALWDKIFSEAGYTYESDFLDSQLFKNLYVISENIAEALLDNSNLYQADNQQVANQVVGATMPWLTPHELADPGANFNPNFSTYTAPATGNYDFLITASDVTISGNPHGDRIVGYEARLVDDATGTILASLTDQLFFPDMDNTAQLAPGQIFPIYAPLGATLTAGQIVRYEFYTWPIQGLPTGTRQIEMINQTSACSYAPNIMSFNAIMPANIRKIDFMKSIINRFKLVFVPSKTQANHFKITPWKDWILQGRAKDWTDKLDTTKDMVIKPLFFDQERFQVWKDQEDSDYLNYNYQLTYKQTYGQLNQDSTNELIKGTHVYQDQFAPTPVDSIGWIGNSATGSVSANDAGKFIIPHIAKDSQTNDPAQPGKREPIQPKLRLVFYNGLQPAPATWYMSMTPYDPASYSTVSKAAFTSYPLMSQYSSWPVTNTTYDLNWTNKPPFWNPELSGANAPGRAQTAYDTYSVYWKTWYDVTFDPYSRLVEANFVINYGETFDLEFNDYVWVKDAWYFVNEIKDYIVGQKTNVRVQLIKLGNNIGITLPIVSPPTYNATLVCTALNPCDAFCCNQSAGATQVTVFPNNASLATSTLVYADQYGTTFATPGIYSDLSGTVQVSGTGAVTVISTTGCNCTPVYYTFTVYKNSTGCDVCCNNGPTVTVYGANPVFEMNSSLFTDTLLTVGAGPGYYKANLATVALQVGTNNGTVVQSYLCSTCQCTTYYPFSVCAGLTNCTSCCCNNGNTLVYGDNASFASCSILYTNNTGTTVAPDGYYKWSNSTVAHVTGGAGHVTGFNTCSSCSCTGPITFTYSVFQQFPGYRTTLALQSSTDNVNWNTVNTLVITPTDQPLVPDQVIYINASAEFDPGTYVRAILTSNEAGSGAGLLGGWQRDDTTVSDYPYGDYPSPGTITISYGIPIEEGYTYNIYGGVLGGSPAPNPLSLDRLFAMGDNNFYQGNASSGAVAINSDATKNTTFDVGTGFGYNTTTLTGVLGVHLSPALDISFPDKPIVYGYFRKYKGSGSIPWGIIGLNNDGTLNTSFNANLGTGIDSAAPTNGALTVFTNNSADYIIVGGDFASFNGHSSRGFAVLNSDGSWNYALMNNVGTGFKLNGNVTNVRITAIIEDINGVYVMGKFNSYNGTACSQIIRLNPTTLVLDSSFSAPQFLDANNNVPTFLNATVLNGTLYLTGTFKKVNGTTYNNLVSLNSNGTINSSFSIGTGLDTSSNNYASVITNDGTDLYVGGKFITYNGDTKGIYLIKLNTSGVLDSTFKNGIGTTPFVINANIAITDVLYHDNALYVAGGFQSYNGTTSRGLVKMSSSNAAIITAFPVNSGLYYNTITNNLGTRLAPVYKPTVTLYPLSLYTGTTACGAFCHTGSSPVTYYGDGNSLYASTEIFTDATGMIPAPTNIYSDGAATYQVYNGVRQSTPLDTTGCNCGGTVLLQYAVNYSSIDACTACCETNITYVYSASSPWSTSTVLYTDQAGTTYAPPGYYSYTQGVCLQVGQNGNVVGSTDCAICQCGVTCNSYWIRNTDNFTASYSYRSCDNVFYYGEFAPGEILITPCMDIGTFMSTGTFKIMRTLYC